MIFLISKITKLIVKVVTGLHLGNGYAFPGYIILKFFPDILRSKKFSYKKGLVLISGTNGKTTTSKLITDILKNSGMKVVSNSSGSNLLRGIVTTLLLDLDFFGNPRSEAGVLEVDEFALPRVLEYLTPRVLILLNLSRDQLDRYGETDTILSYWIGALERLPKKTTLVLDSTQPVFSILKGVSKGPTEFFNAFAPEGIHVKESFNVKNINAALKVSSLYSLNLSKSIDVINNFEYAYGRGECIEYKGNTFRVYLAKNPASFNGNLEVLLDSSLFNFLLFILNDNIPDGKDISWIYDIEPELLKLLHKKGNIDVTNIFVSGSRCYDMAARLKYAGIDVPRSNVFPSLSVLLRELETRGLVGNSFAVLPNYSAMLEFRKLTLGRDIL